MSRRRMLAHVMSCKVFRGVHMGDRDSWIDDMGERVLVQVSIYPAEYLMLCGLKYMWAIY